MIGDDTVPSLSTAHRRFGTAERNPFQAAF